MVKALLERLILDVLEGSSSFCMDSEDDRRALADVLTVDILGRFRMIRRPVAESSSALARVLDNVDG